jgi:hypothetical protein
MIPERPSHIVVLSSIRIRANAASVLAFGGFSRAAKIIIPRAAGFADGLSYNLLVDTIVGGKCEACLGRTAKHMAFQPGASPCHFYLRHDGRLLEYILAVRVITAAPMAIDRAIDLLPVVASVFGNLIPADRAIIPEATVFHAYGRRTAPRTAKVASITYAVAVPVALIRIVNNLAVIHEVAYAVIIRIQQSHGLKIFKGPSWNRTFYDLRAKFIDNKSA